MKRRILEGEGHWTMERPYPSLAAARKAVKGLGRELLRHLRAKGYRRFSAPPAVKFDIDSCVRDKQVRYITAWVPDWSPTPHRGKFVARVDTRVNWRED